jgi:RNA polymerase sigma-70 factor (ECF subfamily)
MEQEKVVYTDEMILAAQIKNGNQLAFATIYDRYGKHMYLLAYRYLKSRDMAEDVVQQVFINFWINRIRINELLNIRSFLFTALKNQTLNTIRDQNRAIAKNYEYLMESYNGSLDESEIEESLEMTSLIEKAVENLSPQRRQIYYLKIMEGYSNQQIADKLNISVNTVKSQYYHILKEIREFVSKNMLTSMVLLYQLFRY